MFRRALTAAVALLVLFHLWLFAGQIWDGRALEPATAMRWLVAGGLIAALAGLRRAGQPMVFGRRAAAIWLLAALLHAPKALDRVQDLQPDLWTEVVSVGLGAAGLGLAVPRGPRRMSCPPLSAARARSPHRPAARHRHQPGLYPRLRRPPASDPLTPALVAEDALAGSDSRR